jgi:predicted dehydrogenase
MAKAYKVGIIGRTGRGNYGHGLDRVWQDVPNVEVAAVADENDQGRTEAVNRCAAKTGYADYRQMLDRERPDIVAICERWIDRHHQLAMACAEHGCHMYMEKPFTRTLEEADDVVAACEMRHLKLAIAHNNRYTPQLTTIKRLIRAGEIGDVLELRIRGKEDRRGGGEDLWVLGTHMLDLMRAVNGDVENCYARVTQKGHPVTAADVYDGNEGIGPLAGDGIDAMYQFKNGATGFFASHRNMAGNPSRFGLRIHGSKGLIALDSGYLKPGHILKDSSWSNGTTDVAWQPISSLGIGQPEPLEHGPHGSNMAAALDLIDAIENDRQPLSSMYDARSAVELIAAVFESHGQSGPVSLPLKNRKNPLTMLDE